ncbi:MAG: ATP-binding cassette domain-containing protein [Candidatus Nanopelagicales bacterium]
MTTLIQLQDVSVRYRLMSTREHNLKRQVANWFRHKPDRVRTVTALDSLTINVEHGARVGLIGSNGAGKSTLLQVMAGVLPPTSGVARIKGRPMALLGGAAAGLDGDASGTDNIVALGVQLGATPKQMAALMDDIVEFSGLEARIDDPIFSYSSGMSARLRFATLTALRPDILLLDEGIGTADAAFNLRAKHRLDEFLSSAGVLVLASHSDDLIRETCSEAFWLEAGRLLAHGPVDEVLQLYRQVWSDDALAGG